MRIKKVSQPTPIIPNTAQITDTYSTSTTDGYSCNYINNRMKLLWTNPSPTSAMTVDSKINLSSDDYDLLVWVYGYNTSNTNLQNSSICVKGNNILLTMIGYSAGALQRRTLTYVSDTQYNVNAAYSSTGGTNTNTMNILLYVYGIKL